MFLFEIITGCQVSKKNTCLKGFRTPRGPPRTGPGLQPWKIWQQLIVCLLKAHPHQWGPSAAPQRRIWSPCFLALPQHLLVGGFNPVEKY